MNCLSKKLNYVISLEAFGGRKDGAHSLFAEAADTSPTKCAINEGPQIEFILKGIFLIIQTLSKKIKFVLEPGILLLFHGQFN